MATPDNETPITPDDLRAKLEGLQNDLQGRVDEKKPTLLGVGVGAAVIVVIVVFLLGKRSGRKRSAVVEIRRL